MKANAHQTMSVMLQRISNRNVNSPVNKNSERSDYKHFQTVDNPAQLGRWQFNAGTKLLTGCVVFTNIFGLNHRHAWGLGEILSLVTTNCRLRFINQVRHAMESGMISTELVLAPAAHDSRCTWVRITGSIQYQEHGIDCGFAGYAEDITHIKNMEAAKEDFPAFLNHEIRNPLTTIQLYIQMIEKKAMNVRDKDLLSWAGRANEQVRALETLTSTYLDAVVISNGLIPIKKINFHLHKYLSSYTDNLRLLNPGRSFDLEIEGLGTIHADRSKIDEVLHNLTGNALKYSKPGSVITIRCKKQFGYYRISVLNIGSGIPDNEQGQLFDKYFRTKHSTCGSVRGHGLGLHIVKRIVEQHSGQVGVICQKECSIEFFFTIPGTKKMKARIIEKSLK